MNNTAIRLLPMLFLTCSGLASADELSADSANTMSCGSNFVSVGDPEDAVLVTGSCFMVAETLHRLGIRDLDETRQVRPARTIFQA